MIEQVYGNLVKVNVDVILHQANCFCTMGSGVAKTIRETYPEAYREDCKTPKGDISKLGTFSFVKTKDRKFVYNLYGQYKYGKEPGIIYTNYNALKTSIIKAKEHIKENISLFARIGIPYKIGCVRGGGEWKVVYNILKELFENDTLTLVICEFNDYTNTKHVNFDIINAYKKAELLGLSELMEED